VDTLGPLDETNTTCGAGTYPPAWVTSLPRTRTGWDGLTSTREYTKILPDGLLTPARTCSISSASPGSPTVLIRDGAGHHVHRAAAGEGPGTDGHRWQQFGVLPDMWKNADYGGTGNACMLFVDLNDGRGTERTWVGIADSLGATSRPAWARTTAGGRPADSTTGAERGEQPLDRRLRPELPAGDDLGHVRRAFRLVPCQYVRQPGDRLANRQNMGSAAGKESRMGPTQEMLNAYYKLLFLASGDVNSRILGPFEDRSQNDVGLIQAFLRDETIPPGSRDCG